MEVWTSSSTEQMSTVFIWVGLANIIGTLLMGPLFDCVNDMLLLTVSLLLEAVFMALAPKWPSLAVFQLMTALIDACHSVIFSGKLVHGGDVLTLYRMNIERLLQKIKTLNIVIQSSKEHACIFSIFKLAAF